MTIVGLKFFNVYGPKEYYKAKTSSMVIQLGHQILDGKAPKLFEGSDKIYRDFIYIEDVIQATVKAAIALNNKFDLNQNQNLKSVYNVGTGKARTFQDIADILQKELNTNYGSEYIPNPYIEQYQFFTQANIEDTKQDLSYTPRFSLEAGIKDYIPEIKRTFELYKQFK
jgi:ADP-L-glycero-D-manno-heptose 6-epimerase